MRITARRAAGVGLGRQGRETYFAQGADLL